MIFETKTLKATLVLLSLGAIFTACSSDDDSTEPAMVNLPTNLSITDNSFFPEDVVYSNNTLYVSGFGNGSVKSFDLTSETPTATEFAAADASFYSSWGLATNDNVVLNVINNPNFDDITMNGPSKLVEYNAQTGAKTNEWDMPANMIGNSVQIVNGKYYVCDWNPTARIIEVNPATGAVNEAWYTNTTDWDPATGGLGGVIYNSSNAFYISQGGKFWYLPINNDGTPGTLQEVSVSGISNIDADGITWAGNNTFYYAENDATDPTGNFGKVYKVVLNDATTATGTIFRDNLNDSSGTWFFNHDGNSYLAVLESQIGVFFGNSIDLPFNIEIIKL